MAYVKRLALNTRNYNDKIGAYIFISQIIIRTLIIIITCMDRKKIFHFRLKYFSFIHFKIEKYQLLDYHLYTLDIIIIIFWVEILKCLGNTVSFSYRPQRFNVSQHSRASFDVMTGFPTAVYVAWLYEQIVSCLPTDLLLIKPQHSEGRTKPLCDKRWNATQAGSLSPFFPRCH